MEAYKITKIGRVENPTHPWSDFGESKEFHVGFFIKEPEIGERFNLAYINYQNQGISTSRQIELLKEEYETI